MVPFAAYQELVRELASLKREGFLPSGSVEAPARVPDLPQPVEAAIIALGVDGPTERFLRSQARELLRAGEEERIVVKRIEDGEEAPL